MAKRENGEAEAKTRRLAEALKANLQRRKEQARRRQEAMRGESEDEAPPKSRSRRKAATSQN